MVAGQNGAGQVVEAGAAGRTAVALAVRLGIVPAVAGDRSAVAARAADAVGPAVLADQLVALASSISDDRFTRAGMGGTDARGRTHPQPLIALIGTLGPTTPKPDKSHN